MVQTLKSHIFRVNFPKFAILVLTATYLAFSSPLEACPVFLFIGSDLEALAQTPKANLHLLSVGDGGVWQEKAVQVDSLDPNGGIIFNEAQPIISASDRLIFNPDAFGRKKPSFLDF